GLVAHGRVVDGRLLLVGQVEGEAALGAGGEPVAQPDVGEGAADHHLVVAPARPVGVEVADLDALFHQVLPGRAVTLDHAGGRDVVGGDAVAEQGQDPGAGDVGQRLGGGGDVGEVGRGAAGGGGRAR